MDSHTFHHNFLVLPAAASRFRTGLSRILTAVEEVTKTKQQFLKIIIFNNIF
jgi:hypothetical protein